MQVVRTSSMQSIKKQGKAGYAEPGKRNSSMRANFSSRLLLLEKTRWGDLVRGGLRRSSMLENKKKVTLQVL